MRWKRRPHETRGDGTCDVDRCGDEWQTCYRRGSSELTQDADRRLCSRHERAFCEELGALRSSRNAPHHKCERESAAKGDETCE